MVTVPPGEARTATAAAPVPGPPKETVGAEVYPDPALVRVTPITLPPAMTATPAAPVPPPPLKETEGATVYPEPPLVTTALPTVKTGLTSKTRARWLPSTATDPPLVLAMVRLPP